MDWIGNDASGAVFSESRLYRYSLWRRWQGRCGPGRMCAFVGLNPSTADETEDDPTVRRCMGFAQAWGYGGMVMLNAFAFRATDPQEMKRQACPIGRLNDEALRDVSGQVDRVICVWGVHGAHLNRGPVAKHLLIQATPGQVVWHLGLTKHGHPKHPLYLPANLTPELWRA